MSIAGDVVWLAPEGSGASGRSVPTDELAIRPRRLAWAELLRRVFAIDVLAGRLGPGHHAPALARAGAEDAVVADEVEARRRHQRRELLDELGGLEKDVGGAVAPAMLQAIEEPAIGHPGEPLGGDRGPSDIAA